MDLASIKFFSIIFYFLKKKLLEMLKISIIKLF